MDSGENAAHGDGFYEILIRGAEDTWIEVGAGGQHQNARLGVMGIGINRFKDFFTADLRKAHIEDDNIRAPISENAERFHT